MTLISQLSQLVVGQVVMCRINIALFPCCVLFLVPEPEKSVYDRSHSNHTQGSCVTPYVPWPIPSRTILSQHTKENSTVA
jgi:hypothetical protein